MVFHCFLKSAYPVAGVAVAVAGVAVAAGARPSKSVILPLYEYRLAFSRNILFPGVVEAVVAVAVVAVAVAVAGVAVEAVAAVVANLCDLSFVVVCKFRLDTVLYDFSFTKTSGVSSAAAGVEAAGVEAAVAAAGVLLFRSLALLYSSLISTWISLGAFVSIIYFLEIVSKYL